MILPIDKIYAQKLRSLRIKKEIKQESLAEMLGLKSQQLYSKLELGQKHFTVEIIKHICLVFAIKEADFKADLLETENYDQHKNLSSIKEELEMVKTILSLKSQVNDFHTLTDLMYTKLMLEKEIEIIKLKIENITSVKRVYRDGHDKFIAVELL